MDSELLRGLRLGVCGCGRVVPWDSLRMSTVVYWQPVSENRFPYSRYHPSFWSCDAVSRGRISDGPFLHEYDVRYDSQNQPAEINGSQTWAGEGTFRAIQPVDCSSVERFVVAAEIGPYQRNERSQLEIIAGIGNANLSAQIILVEEQTAGQRRIWAHAKVSDIELILDPGALFFFFTVKPVADNAWYVDRLQLEFRGRAPGHYVATSGSPVVYERPAKVMTMAKTCPDCRQRLPARIDTNVLTQEMPGPIPVDTKSEVI